MFETIKKFAEHLVAEIESLFESYITKYEVPTINVLNEIKKAIDNPIVDFGAKLAAIPMFPEVKAFLDKAIPEAVLALGIIQVDLTPKLDAEGKPIPLTTADYCDVLITYLRAQPAMVQAGALTEIAGFITKLAHGSLTQAQAVLIVKSAEVKLEQAASTTTTTTTI